MTKITAAVLGFVLLIALVATAANTPFPPWLESLSGAATISSDGVVAIASSAVTGAKIAEPTTVEEGLFGAKVARFVYDTAGGAGAIGAHTLGVTLPARAVIVRSYFKVITQFTDSGSGTVAISCEDANNIKTATDITGSAANAFVEGQSTGAISAAVRDIAAACVVTATVATATQDAGKLVGWVHYVLEN